MWVKITEVLCACPTFDAWPETATLRQRGSCVTTDLQFFISLLYYEELIIRTYIIKFTSTILNDVEIKYDYYLKLIQFYVY